LRASDFERRVTGSGGPFNSRPRSMSLRRNKGAP
jgi:hypothetical protein